MINIIRPKNKYMIEVTRGKGKGIDEDGYRLPVRYYQTNKTEAMYDAYWAFIFSNAVRVRIRSARDRHHKIYREFNSVADWKKEWLALYGEHANYMVWKDRH